MSISPSAHVVVTSDFTAVVDEYGLNVHIEDSYKIKDKDKQIKILEYLHKSYSWFKERSIKSYLREWRAHNRLYKLGLFRRHTKDVDLNVKESMFRRFIYFFIGF